MNKETAVVLLSGGLDSTVLLYRMAAKYPVRAISFDYGQIHNKELDFASRTAVTLGIKHEIIDLSDVGKMLESNALTGDVEIPEGHYEAESMKDTIVPNRNMIMISIATALAIDIEASFVCYAEIGRASCRERV